LITRGWDHTRVDYVKDIPEVEDLQKVDIVAVTGIHRTELGRRVTEDEGSAWHLELYGLRPGWTVAVYYRQDLWDAYQEAGGREAWGWPIPESDDIFEPQKDKRYWTRRDKRRYAETGASRK
jgi:hypothetical protein